MSHFKEIIYKKKSKYSLIKKVKDKTKDKEFKNLASKDKDSLLETLSKLHDLI